MVSIVSSSDPPHGHFAPPLSPSSPARQERIATARLAIICGNRIKAEALHYFCATYWGFDVVAVEFTGAEGIAAVARTSPSFVLALVAMADLSPEDFIGRLHAVAPGAKLIGLVSPRDEYLISRLTTTPWHGLLSDTDESLEALGHAIERVREGTRFVSVSIANCQHALRNSPGAFPKLLTHREMSVMVCIAHCLSDSEIGRQLGFSEVTAQSHRKNIMRKLGVHSAPKLIGYGIARGFHLVPLPNIEKAEAA